MRASAAVSATTLQSKPPPGGGGGEDLVRGANAPERARRDHGVTVVLKLAELFVRFGSVVVVVTVALFVIVRGTPWTVI